MTFGQLRALFHANAKYVTYVNLLTLTFGLSCDFVKGSDSSDFKGVT